MSFKIDNKIGLSGNSLSPVIDLSLLSSSDGNTPLMFTTSDFTQPAVHNVVSNVQVNENIYGIFSPVLIPNSGIYTITAQNSPTSIDLALTSLLGKGTQPGQTVPSNSNIFSSGFTQVPQPLNPDFGQFRTTDIFRSYTALVYIPFKYI